MKYLGTLVFIAALSWSWSLIHSFAPIPFETHVGIQIKLADVIKSSLEKAHPGAQNMQISRLWTETLANDKVRAVFSLKFQEGEGADLALQNIQGEAYLHREGLTQDAEERWILDKILTTSGSLTYSEGLVITPGTGDDAQDSNP